MGDAGLIHQANVMAAGVAAGFTGTVLGHPLDLIKVRLQARSEYKGTVDCLKKTFKSDGFTGMFRGLTSPLFVSLAVNSMTFGAYNKFNKVQESLLTQFDSQQDQPHSSQLQFYNHFISGGAVGILCSTMTCPFEVIKIRMQLDDKASGGVTRRAVGGPSITALSHAPVLTSSQTTINTTTVESHGLRQRRYAGFFDCAMQTWKQGGLRGFFTGFMPTTIRDVAFCATYFSVYEMFKRQLNNHPLFKREGGGGGFSPIPIILSGGVAGALSWLVAFPFDVVKTAMQDSEGRRGNPNVSRTTTGGSMLAVARSHYQKVGMSGFYSGLVPAVCRAFIVSSVRFSTYEAVLCLLDKSTQKLQ